MSLDNIDVMAATPIILPAGATSGGSDDVW